MQSDAVSQAASEAKRHDQHDDESRGNTTMLETTQRIDTAKAVTYAK